MSHIFLYGPPGTGKSTIGKILARQLKLPFVDLDHVIESNAGKSIVRIMGEQGEDTFRDLESETLKDAVGQASSATDKVIALGGGALLREENRKIAERAGSVILLSAGLETLLSRLHTSSHKRPLLAGDLREKLTSLLARRKEHYDSFPLRIDVNREPEELAWQIQVALGQFHLSAMGEYDVVVQNGGIDLLGEMLRTRGLQNPMVVTDQHVAQFHTERVGVALDQAGFAPKIITIPAGEEQKNLNTISDLWELFPQKRIGS